MPERCAPWEPLLSAWVDGELSDVERAAVGGHLQHCPRCRHEVATLRVTRSMLQSMPVRELPAGLSESLLARHGRAVRPPSPPSSSDAAGPRRRAEQEPSPVRPRRPARPAPPAGASRRPGQRRGRIRRVVARASAGAAAAVGLLGMAAFALGGQPDPATRTVAVPVEVFVADHLVRAVGGPVSTPVLLEGRR